MERDVKLDHPCRETCSGWKQGYERAVYDLVAWLQTKQPGESELNAVCYRIAGDEIKKYFVNKT